MGPPKKGKLKRPQFEISEFGGGPQRKRYQIDFKLKATGYALTVAEGGNGPGGTAGSSYGTRVR